MPIGIFLVLASLMSIAEPSADRARMPFSPPGLSTLSGPLIGPIPEPIILTSILLYILMITHGLLLVSARLYLLLNLSMAFIAMIEPG